jgi:hypothetical protein
MNARGSLADEELRRQDKLGGIADWYREEASFHEIERSGRDVLLTVDHLARVIRVESFDPYTAQRTPIEERMEFDADVLSRIKAALLDRNHAVILDCSDVPGKLGFGPQSTRGLSARLLVVDIDSGEVLDERTVMKERPCFPERLQHELLAVPRVEGASYVIRRAHVAERFVDDFLHAPSLVAQTSVA